MTSRATIWHSNQLSYTHHNKNLYIGAGEENRTLATGLEGQGSTTELHPHIIFKLVEGIGFEPMKAQLTDLQSVPFGQLGNPSILELVKGLEPSTY